MRSHGTRWPIRWRYTIGQSGHAPGQDAGEALVGVDAMCGTKMNGLAGVQGPAKIDKYDPYGTPRKFAYRTLDQRVNGAYFAHARLGLLGRPTP